MSALDETKRRYVHRRLTSELSLSDARNPKLDPEHVDSILRELTEQTKDKVKLDDLAGIDKKNLLLLFVEN